MAIETVPSIDITPFLSDAGSARAQGVVRDMKDAASTWGFFLLKGARISSATQTALLQSAKDFFALPLEEKMELDVSKGGAAWRGYMLQGGEHTHGRQDWKEGLYLGPEHDDDHPLVGVPLHGRNQLPDSRLPRMRHDVLSYLDQMTDLGKTLTDMLSLGLGLNAGYMRGKLLAPEPVVLFRCFKYTPLSAASGTEGPTYGIGEHTDFGYLTILKVDSPGLQVPDPADTSRDEAANGYRFSRRATNGWMCPWWRMPLSSTVSTRACRLRHHTTSYRSLGKKLVLTGSRPC